MEDREAERFYVHRPIRLIDETDDDTASDEDSSDDEMRPNAAPPVNPAPNVVAADRNADDDGTARANAPILAANDRNGAPNDANGANAGGGPQNGVNGADAAPQNGVDGANADAAPQNGANGVDEEREEAEALRQEVERVQAESRARLEEIFPHVCRTWIARAVVDRDVNNIVQYVIENGDSVPRIERKRHREQVDGPESPSATVPAKQSFFEAPPVSDRGGKWSEHRTRWMNMSTLERAKHHLMVDALFDRLKALLELPARGLSGDDRQVNANCFSKDNMAVIKQFYYAVRVPFIDRFLSYSSGELTVEACFIVLELLQVDEEERLSIIRTPSGRCLFPPSVARPFTKAPRAGEKKQEQIRRMFYARENPVAESEHLSPEWKKVNQIVTKNYEDKVDNFECEICFDRVFALESLYCVPPEEGATPHRFCFACVEGQARACCEEGRIVAGGLGVPCLVDCKGHITTVQLRECGLDRQVISQLEKRMEQEALQGAGVPIERCKYCSFGVCLEVAPEVDKVFVCRECSAEFCRLCNKDWDIHMGKKCNELETAQEEARKKLEDELTAAMIHTCPRCHVSFEKLEGCNKMTCRCGLTMCYVCRKTDIDYKHFCQHIRDPAVNQGGCPENCAHPCLLWQKVDKTLEEKRKELLEKARNDDMIDDQIVDRLGD